MKQTTKRKIVAVAAVPIMAAAGAGLPLVLSGCDNSKSTVRETPQDWDAVSINGLFSNNSSANVKGVGLTPTEWNNAPNAIAAALNNNEIARDLFISVFNHGDGVTIAVVANPEFEKYSTTRGVVGTVYINFAILNNAEVLGQALQDAARVMGGNPNLPEVVRARDGYQKMRHAWCQSP